MNVDFLNQYAVPVIVGICLCVGYIIKNMLPGERMKRYIPLIMGVLGAVLALWINGAMNPNILLQGLFSGLASTGLYELFHNLLKKE